MKENELVMGAGLTTKEVEISRRNHGSNEVNIKKNNTFLKLLIESLGDPIIKILIIALAIKVIFLFHDFDWFETIGILIAILLASFISTISEFGSEKAFEKLQQETAKNNCFVIRNKKVIEILVSEVVVGDIVILNPGSIIPADGILVNGDIFVNESMLTGEAKEVHKKPDKKNELFKGTIVCSKKGYMQVTKVGHRTLYGELAEELTAEKPVSPIKKRLTRLAGQISKFGYLAAALATVAYLFSVIVIANDFDPVKITEMLSSWQNVFIILVQALTICVTIIIVAVPEGLPMMITLVLSSNMRRLLKDKILVRKLSGIETAGNINLLLTDKTGTLTKGHLQVSSIVDGDLNTYNSVRDIKRVPKYNHYAMLSMLVNNESYITDGKVLGGNSTDRAFTSFYGNELKPNVKILDEIPFDSERKYAIKRVEDHGKINLIKGAPELFIKKCKSYINQDGQKKALFNNRQLEAFVNEQTNQGFRVLCLVISDHEEIDQFESLTFVGFILIKDEIRSTARDSVSQVTRAGIQTIMVTGDNIGTATSIAKEVGICNKSTDIIMSSDEFNEKSDLEIVRMLPNIKVIARAKPKDKSRLVNIGRNNQYVVGMTGDGINDAPALKQADVGFAMGTGSDIAKEASDIVLINNDFKAIVKAILYGRTIFKSIRKFIIFQLTLNVCAVILSVIGPLTGIAAPITIIQMLWINMVMDTLAGIAFSFEPPLDEYMEEKPKKLNEEIVNPYMRNAIIVNGIFTAAILLVFLKSDYINSLFINDANHMTAFFGLFIFFGIFNSFNARTHRINIFANIFRNKIFLAVIAFVTIVQIYLLYYGGELFRTTDLLITEFQIMIAIAFLIVPFDMIRKRMVREKKAFLGV